MPRRGRNKKYYKKNTSENNYQSNNNNNLNQKWSNKNRHSRKIVLKPSQIDFISDSRSSEQGSHNKNRNRVVENLKDMGLANTKLSIGETDQEIKKALIESRPHCQLSCVPENVFEMIIGYVQKYFNCYDCNREGLLSAYNPKVTFSLCLNMSSQCTNRSFRFEDAYYRDNRNLKRLSGRESYHDEKRSKLLHHGKIDTVNLITKLPPTEHDPASFRLDSCYFSTNMIAFSLTGVFKEGKSTDKVRPLRSFYRSFVCVPDPEIQMTIINDQYVISNITGYQYKKYFQQNRRPNDSAQASSEPSTSSNNVVDEQTRMIKQFSTESKLNLEWSKYCLDHAQWNYEQAAKIFMEYKDSIPKEAFLV